MYIHTKRNFIIWMVFKYSYNKILGKQIVLKGNLMKSKRV